MPKKKTAAEKLKQEHPDLWLLVRPGAVPTALQHGDLIYNQEAEGKLSILAWKSKDAAGDFWSANQELVGDWQVTCVTFADFKTYMGTLAPEQREAIFLRMG